MVTDPAGAPVGVKAGVQLGVRVGDPPRTMGGLADIRLDAHIPARVDGI